METMKYLLRYLLLLSSFLSSFYFFLNSYMNEVKRRSGGEKKEGYRINEFIGAE